MKPSQAAKLIGKQVQWEDPVYRGRTIVPLGRIRGGLLEDVQGGNVKVDGEWHWLQGLHAFREVP